MSGRAERRGIDLFRTGAIPLALPIFLTVVAVGLGLLLAFRPLLALGLVVVAAGAAYATIRPLHGLVLILCLVAILGSDSILKIEAGIEWVEVDLILVMAGLGWLARWLTRDAGLRWSRLDVAILLFAVAVTIGTYRGLSDGIALSDLRSELRPPGYLVLVYAIARTSIRRSRQARNVFLVLTIATLISALKAIAVYVAVPIGAPGEGEQLVWATRVLNSDGFKRVIVHGAETFPVLAGLMILPSLAVSRSVRGHLLAWVMISVFLLALVISMTRSYWAGLAAGILCLLVTQRPRISGRLLAELAGVVATGALLLFLLQAAVPGFSIAGVDEQVRHRLLESTAPGVAPSSVDRLAEIESIREAAGEHPWLGTGLGSTYLFYSEIGGGLKEWEYTHNSYAYWTMKLGLAGLASFLSVLVFGLAAAVAWLRRCRSREEGSLASGLLAGLVALITISMTAPWLTHYVGAAWTGLVLGSAESMRLERMRSIPGDS